MDEIAKMQSNDSEKKRKSNYDKYISIQTKIKYDKIPALRKIHFREDASESASKIQDDFQLEETDSNESTNSINAKAEAELKLQQQKEYERYLFLRRYNENRFMKLIKLRKNKGDVPAPGRYSPNYNAIKKRNPNTIFEYPIYGPNKISLEISAPLKRKRKPKKKPLLQQPPQEEQEHKLTDKTAHTIENEEHTHQSNREIDIYGDFYAYLQSQQKRRFSLPKIKKKRKSTISIKHVEGVRNVKMKKSESAGFIKEKIQSVFFDKMIGRKEEKLVQNAPATGTYNPRYECVNKNIQNVLFDGMYGRDEKHYKKMLIHKVIHSYNVNEDYSVMKMKWKSALKEKKKIRTRETKMG